MNFKSVFASRAPNQKIYAYSVVAFLVLLLFIVFRKKPEYDEGPLAPAYFNFVHTALSEKQYPAWWFDTQQFVTTNKPAFSQAQLRSWYRVSIPATLEEIRRLNEHTRQSVPNWIARSDWEMKSDGGRSFYWYGLPAHAFSKINLEVGGYPIQHDLISYVGSLLGRKIVYLEIGVSVGKGLYTQLNFLGPDSEVVALDIEDINPTLQYMLEPAPGTKLGLKKEWTEASGRVGSIKQFTHRGTRLSYVAGDEYNDLTWKNLQTLAQETLEAKFNLVLSDAMHVPSALLQEIDQLIKHDLLDLQNPFAMFWDDCDGPLAEAFWGPVRDKLTGYAHTAGHTSLQFSRISVYGWLGKYEQGGRRHATCVVLNAQSKDLLQRAYSLDTSFQAGCVMLEEGSID